MRKLEGFVDAFFVVSMVFLIANSFALANTTACVELTTAFLMLIVVPLVAVTEISLNWLYVFKYRSWLIQGLRYLNIGFIVTIMGYYWLVYNVCTIT